MSSFMISFEPAQILDARASAQAAGDAILVHVAVAAPQLQAGVENVVLRLRGPPLRLGRVDRGQRAVYLPPSRTGRRMPG